MTRTTLCMMALTLATLLSACASYPPPNERMATAEAAIRGAMEAGATQIPRAQLHLKLAQEQTEKAKRLMQDGYHQRADLSLRRAQSDAELAVAISREHQTIDKANAAKATVAKIRQ